MRTPALSPVVALGVGAGGGVPCLGGTGCSVSAGFVGVGVGGGVFLGMRTSFGLGEGSDFGLTASTLVGGAGGWRRWGWGRCWGFSLVRTESSLKRCFGGQREGVDHGGLDGTGGWVRLAPVGIEVMAEPCGEGDGGDDGGVADERDDEAAGDIFPGG